MPRDVKLATFDEMLAELEALGALRASAEGAARSDGGWTLAQVVIHIAQGIDYSIAGYPTMRSALFRGTIGRIALGRFLGRGQMSHDLQAPIPGAPSLPADAKLADARARLQKSVADFRALAGTPAPHFAYGPLSKSQYEAIHAMHFANHVTVFARP